MNAMRIQAGGRIDQASDTNDRMLYLTAVISVVLLILMLPFLSWIRLINTEALFDVMKVKGFRCEEAWECLLHLYIPVLCTG